VLPVIALLLAASSAIADSVATRERQLLKVADDVYVIRYKEDPSPGFIFANTTVIIGDREVFVVDSDQTPAQACEDIAQIHQLTDKPVRYLLNTHWHTDHNGGNHEYMAVFPSIAIIATSETRKMMDEFAPYVLSFWMKQVTAVREGLTRRLQTGKGSDGKPLTEADKNALPARLKMVDDFVADVKTFVYQPPTITFEHELTLYMGARAARFRYDSWEGQIPAVTQSFIRQIKAS
jgi:cyclase